MKDPVKPNTNTNVPPQPAATKSNAPLVIILVFIVIFVAIPLFFIYKVFNFVEGHFDDFKDLVNDGISEGVDSLVSLDEERWISVRNVSAQANDERLRELGMSKKDCENLRAMADLYGDGYIKSVEGNTSVCDDTSLRISANYEDIDTKGIAELYSFSTLHVSNGEQCGEYVFTGAYNKLVNYNLISSSLSCSDAKTIKIVDTGDEASRFDAKVTPFSLDDDGDEDLEDFEELKNILTPDRT